MNILALPRVLAVLVLAAASTACNRQDSAATPPPAAAPESPAAVAAGATLDVDGSAFVLRMPDGRVLRGRELEGAVIHVGIDGGQVAPMKLKSITPDPKQPQVLRHEFETSDGQGGWKNACAPNADGETWGLPLKLAPGHPGRDGEITVSCISGVVAKCVRWGYPPWEKGPSGESLAPFHAACVRMARADYCGDGTPHTKQGTSIDNFDDLGIQKRGAADDASYVFEAGWSPQGAVCVAHTRWNDVVTLDQLKAQCPRLSAIPHCDENSARALGARMFNHSRLLPAK
ncbi:ADYC domain-containing protein [Nevskia ramosa]|uniref:ADYC domain-containing protein n=1 Tax=Nevskia ramosa TaxID=64002 RepID=UPI0003B6E752|nr:ADYC domain-containing protein [Nevskia ramosa]